MILIEREPLLPAVVETSKAQVVTCLRALHAFHEFDTVGDLRQLVDQVLDEMAVAGVPRGLTRILLFFRTPAAVTVLANRMIPGGTLMAFRTPGCWMDLAKRLPELRAWAERAEPGWTDRPKGI